MKPVLTATEYRRVEEAHPGDLSQAMEKAGYAVALAAARHGAGYGKRVVVLAGPGNNGGDGYVAARYLHNRGATVEVHRLAKPATPLAIAAAKNAAEAGVRIVDLGEVVPADIVIDALFGSSARTPLPESVEAWMQVEVPIVAVDYPSGVDPDTGNVADSAFQATETITFGTPKTGQVTGQGPDHCGRLTMVDIGIEGGRPSMFIAEASDAPRPSRDRRDHKWSAGAVLVVGGSSGMVGAAALTARAALQFGAGTVYLSSPNRDQAHIMAPGVPTVSIDDATEMLDRFDVVVVGPGLAAADVAAVLPLVAQAPRVLLDAGGLRPEVLEAAVDNNSEVVVTPHHAEFKRIAGVGAGNMAIRAFAGKARVVNLLKGNPTTITSGDLPVLVTTGGPELATAGTGDVLAGMIGALWARGLDPQTAATSGAYWHGVAAADLSRTGTVTAERLVASLGSYAW